MCGLIEVNHRLQLCNPYVKTIIDFATFFHLKHILTYNPSYCCDRITEPSGDLFNRGDNNEQKGT